MGDQWRIATWVLRQSICYSIGFALMPLDIKISPIVVHSLHSSSRDLMRVSPWLVPCNCLWCRTSYTQSLQMSSFWRSDYGNQIAPWQCMKTANMQKHHPHTWHMYNRIQWPTNLIKVKTGCFNGRYRLKCLSLLQVKNFLGGAF